MKRRDFMKTMGMSAALVSTSGMYSITSVITDSGKEKKLLHCKRTRQEIPLIQNIDVFIAGGTSAAVHCAGNLAKSGAKVFLSAEEPYLGTDICGKFNFWEQFNATNLTGELQEKLFPKGRVAHPLEVKKALDDYLIDNKVDFLYSSFVTELLKNESGEICGAILSNRNGNQAILAKVIIDATPNALIARLAGEEMSEFKPGKYPFTFTVVGNKPKYSNDLNTEILEPSITIDDVVFPVTKYTMEIQVKEGSFSEIADAEQLFRDKTWDVYQIDSSDEMEFLPFKRVLTKDVYKGNSFKAKKLSIEHFQCSKYDNLHILSACANFQSDELRSKLLRPGILIELSNAVTKNVIEQLKTKQAAELKNVSIYNSDLSLYSQLIHGDTYDFIRSAHIKGFISAGSTQVPVIGEYEAIIAGGGTAGASAGISCARQGLKTLVIEYMHGLGGIGTMGQICTYYHGYREGFTKEIDAGVEEMKKQAPDRKFKGGWLRDWKMEWLRAEIRKMKGDIWFGIIIIGTLVEEGTVKGVVVATPFGKAAVLANYVIDSTGSADVAIAGGAEYKYTDGDSVAIQGAGLPAINSNLGYINTDWTFINDSDIYDTWRTFVTAKKKYKGAYDIGKLLQTRERRRVVGEYEVSVLDVYNKRVYDDSFSYHLSSFDTHGFTLDPFFNLKPPGGHGVDVPTYVPYRALVPKGLKNILVTGLGASAHRDAMPVIRMQPCLQNQGYSVGLAVAMAKNEKVELAQIDLKKLQGQLLEIGNLPPEFNNTKDHYPPAKKDFELALNTVTSNFENLEILLWNTDETIPLMKERFKNEHDADKKLVFAHILGTLGVEIDATVLIDKIKSFKSWDEGWNYTGMGQFGKCMSYLDSLIIAAGRTGDKNAFDAIAEKASMLRANSDFSHIRAISIAFEALDSEKATGILADLLQMPEMGGHAFSSIEKALHGVQKSTTDTSTRNKSLKELFLARSLYFCGDKGKQGEKTLKQYQLDLRGHYARFAQGILEENA